MINLFVQENDEIKIKFAVAVSKDSGSLYVDISRSDLETMVKDFECEIEDHFVIFKKPSFKDMVEMSKGFSSDGVEVKIDVMKGKMQRLLTLLKSWSVRDAQGNIIIPSEGIIEKLHPIVAEFLVDQLDLELGPIVG